MGIGELLDMRVVLNILVNAESMRKASDLEDSVAVPAMGENNSDHAASFENIPIGVGNESLVGGLGIPEESADAPAQVELGPKSAGDVVEDTLSKFNELPFESLAVKSLIRGLSFWIANISIGDGRNMFDHPSHDRIVDRHLEL